MENLDTYTDERMWRAKLDDRKDYKSRLVGRVWDFHFWILCFQHFLCDVLPRGLKCSTLVSRMVDKTTNQHVLPG